MVCNRCITAVKNDLERLGHTVISTTLGEATLAADEIDSEQLEQIKNTLEASGFELIDDRKSRTIEKIKTVIIDAIHYSGEQPREKYSELISKHLHYEYTYLSKLFSEVEGITIEQYIINQKIEKIKEYIVYDELSLSEIADRMGYSSVAHLSAQFKKSTGLPPSHFKNIGVNQRKPLDKVSKN